MGQCGCSDNLLDMAKLDLADGILVISVYPGCEECGQLAGVDIKKLSKSDYDVFVDDRNIKDIKDIDENGFAFPVVAWEEIGKAITEDCTVIEEYNSFEDFWHDHMDRVREAAFNTVKSFWKKSAESASKTKVKKSKKDVVIKLKCACKEMERPISDYPLFPWVPDRYTCLSCFNEVEIQIINKEKTKPTSNVEHSTLKIERKQGGADAG